MSTETIGTTLDFDARRRIVMPNDLGTTAPESQNRKLDPGFVFGSLSALWRRWRRITVLIAEQDDATVLDDSPH